MDLMTAEFLVVLLKIVVPFLIIFQIAPFLVWVERKGSAYIQDRPGPNRAAIMGVRAIGLIHSLADPIKLLFKEDIIPSQVHRFYYILSPFIAVFVACVTFLVIPFADTIPEPYFAFQSLEIDAGVLYILAMASLGVFGIMLAGWSSNNKFARLGGLRSSAQMISYELAMGLALIAVIMWVGSLALNEMVLQQTASISGWFFVREPLACLIFIVASFAETNRAPFDLPEGESELVAGYHTEYSSMKFSMFFLAEYINMVIASALIVTVFFGGWQVPFFSTADLRANAHGYLENIMIAMAAFSIIGGTLLSIRFKKGRYGDKRDYEPLVFGIPGVLTGLVLICALVIWGGVPFTSEISPWVAAGYQITMFFMKVLFFCWVFIWVRWTVPRIRYDQLMDLGWKVMLPLAMLNLVVTAVRMILA